ncbi:hypothetical protein JKI95_09895 [Corynebacterium aquatimens]|uniref:8-oxoguanine DNA glycosylase OGG fold protein n=1 Tax=Corynebacterium TaxID=1716 RepID=UPI001F3616E7|nr:MULTISPECIES: hypothetical protein [Corynebacterium]QYH19400.1 hypothetical protein JKI95_09895 [Corynebacterium aquatimens]UIZ91682.1 hypothetical protein JZY91_08040 [Corynebacterium sp. CNCTC7651]
MANQLTEALEAVKPTTGDVLEHSVTFSPIRWKTGWPHHLRRVPPFRDDARASITRREVFDFAADVRDSGYNRDQIIDFLGAALAYRAGQTNQVMEMQQFLRNKGKAAQLLNAIRQIEGKNAVEAYESLTATGLPPKFASSVAYFLAGEQEDGEADKPVIICNKRAEVAGLEPSGAWTAEKYGEYLSRLREARDAFDASLPLDAVEYAAREFAEK